MNLSGGFDHFRKQPSKLINMNMILNPISAPLGEHPKSKQNRPWWDVPDSFPFRMALILA